MTRTVGTIFVLPGLGLAASAADPLAVELGERFRVVGVDLPGHGGAPDAADATAQAQVDAVAAVIEAECDGGPWLLCAHSMGGKVAALVAARMRDGDLAAFGLAGLVLLAPSPPSPEPMPDAKRAEMLGWARGATLSETDAATFVADNVGGRGGDGLSDVFRDQAVASVRGTSVVAWRRWLQTGSREDVTDAVGVLEYPVTVLGGTEDALLGASAQPELLADVYPRARFVSLPGAGHLLPYERPREVARAIDDLWQRAVDPTPAVPREWGRLIASERTIPAVRAQLGRRAVADDPAYEPRALDADQLTLLREVADRVVAQGSSSIDLAGRVDAGLAQGLGDGWRSALLPADVDAYRRSLDDLALVWPADAAGRDALLRAVAAGDGIPGAASSADALQRWFEDARVDLVREWLGHPASLVRIGYDGFATGAADVALAGYTALGAGERDAWEPAELGEVAR